MRHRLIVARNAADELKEAYSWSRGRYPAATRELRSELRTILNELCDNPLSWSIWRGPNIRRRLLPHFPYAIYYRIDHSVVIVVAIIHCHRDITRRLPEDP